MTPELAKILDCDLDTNVNGMQVSFEICNYIRNNKLKNPDNDCEFIVDDVLKNILNTTDNTMRYVQIPILIDQQYVSK